MTSPPKSAPAPTTTPTLTPTPTPASTPDPIAAPPAGALRVGTFWCLPPSAGVGRFRPIRNVQGQPYGWLTPEELLGAWVRPIRGVWRSGGSLWRCRCSCGGEKVCPLDWLQRGAVRTCGCSLRYASQNGMIAARLRAEADLWVAALGKDEEVWAAELREFAARVEAPGQSLEDGAAVVQEVTQFIAEWLADLEEAERDLLWAARMARTGTARGFRGAARSIARQIRTERLIEDTTAERGRLRAAQGVPSSAGRVGSCGRTR